MAEDKKEEKKEDKKADASAKDAKKDAGTEAEGGKKKKPLIIIAIAVIVLATVGGGAAFFLLKKKAPAADEHAAASDEHAKPDDHAAPAAGEVKKDEHAAKPADDGHGTPAKDDHAAKPADDGHGAPAPAASSSGEKPVAGNEFGYTYNFKTFHLNLGNPLENHYIRLEVAVEYKGGADQKAEIERRLPQLRDAVVSVASRKSREFLLGPDGKDQLRREVLIRLNRYMTKPLEAVYITDMLIE